MENGKILIEAVVVVVSWIAAFTGGILWWWERFHKRKTAAIEQRKKEAELEQQLKKTEAEYEKALEKKERERQEAIEKKERESAEQHLYYLNLLNQQSQLTADTLLTIKDGFLLANERLLSEMATHIKFADDLSSSIQVQFKEVLDRITILERKQEQIIDTVKDLQSKLHILDGRVHDIAVSRKG